jgi:hypothetical protein
MKLSIITINRNNGNGLRKTLASVGGDLHFQISLLLIAYLLELLLGSEMGVRK